MRLLNSHFTSGTIHSPLHLVSQRKKNELVPVPAFPAQAKLLGLGWENRSRLHCPVTSVFWMGQAGKFSAPPSCSYLLSYVKENNKEPGHYDHKHSTSLHASKNGALDYESTLSFCTNRQFNQTSVINGSMKRHSDNGIIRTQVLSILCHRGKCTTTRAVTEPSLCQYP